MVSGKSLQPSSNMDSAIALVKVYVFGYFPINDFVKLFNISSDIHLKQKND